MVIEKLSYYDKQEISVHISLMHFINHHMAHTCQPICSLPAPTPYYNIKPGFKIVYVIRFRNAWETSTALSKLGLLYVRTQVFATIQVI
jgi:hypothetical protein